MKNILTFLFDPRGKLSRKSYAVVSVIWIFVFLIPAICPIEASKLDLSLYLLSFMGMTCASIKRFHDLNMSGFKILLLYIPLINIYYEIVLFCARSKSD
jgi:uncharacterized membrane protein YhaH (DUF805 family)